MWCWKRGKIGKSCNERCLKDCISSIGKFSYRMYNMPKHLLDVRLTHRPVKFRRFVLYNIVFFRFSSFNRPTLLIHLVLPNVPMHVSNVLICVFVFVFVCIPSLPSTGNVRACIWSEYFIFFHSLLSNSHLLFNSFPLVLFSFCCFCYA